MRRSSAVPDGNSAAVNRALFRIHGFSPEAVFERLPRLRGRPISVTYRPELTAWRGDLLSRKQKGNAVYAGSFLRRRRIVLDQHMLRTPRILERIFVHEIFHFVWSRLGRPTRDRYEQLILSEWHQAAAGELGWSAESLKEKILPDDVALRTRRWKDYLCESFCDTAGWLYGGSARYSERTLGREWRDARRTWMREHIEPRTLTV